MGLFLPWPENLAKAGIQNQDHHSRARVNKNLLEKNSKFAYELKTVPYSVYSAKNSLEAGDSFVRIVLFKPLQAVIIESEELAQSVRQIFEMVWTTRH